MNLMKERANNINEFYLTTVADHVVFVSEWLQKIYHNIGMEKIKHLLLAGANSEIFNSKDSLKFDKEKKIRIVTHHWSSHVNKGFKVYKMIDELLEKDFWKDKIEFTYIGNSSTDFILKNTTIVEPLSGKNLSRRLKDNHIYVTGSINEPSGNHHIEAAQWVCL